MPAPVASVNEEGQLRLLPDSPPELSVEHMIVDLIDFPPTGPKPDAALKRSVAALGVIEPVIVQGSMVADTYTLIEGRRRLLAAIDAGLQTVPVVVVPETVSRIEALTLALSLHATRSNNEAAEYRQVHELLGGGASEQQIARATGLSVQTIRARMRLRSLSEKVILDAFFAGTISASVAEAVAKLPKEQQHRLADRLLANGKLTADDLRGARLASQQRVIESLPMDVLGALPDGAGPQPKQEASKPLTYVQRIGTIATAHEVLKALDHGDLDDARRLLNSIIERLAEEEA